jgi:hypothetical protein
MDYGVQANVWGRIRVQLRRYLLVIRRVWWLLPLTTALGMCIAAWVVSEMPPAYESSGTMIYSGQYQLATGGAVYDEQLSNYFGTQIQLMLSPTVQQDAITRVETLHPELKQETPDYKVTQVPQASMVLLRVTARSPDFAQAYLDSCMPWVCRRKSTVCTPSLRRRRPRCSSSRRRTMSAFSRRRATARRSTSTSSTSSFFSSNPTTTC